MYKSEITKIGELAPEMIEENTIILFYDDVPEDLHEVSILHKNNIFEGEVEVGDKLEIGKYSYEIVDIGCTANKTLNDLGHCTLKFGNGKKVNLPGEIQLSGEVPKDIKEGISICFLKK